MQLIDSYLHEVGQYLPSEQRTDILAELRSQLEDEVLEEVGDEPSREQIEAVLNRYGHPINVASSYKEPRFLIGPELYPAFIETISTVFVVSFVAVVSLQLLAWVTNGWSFGPGDLVQKLISVSLWLTGGTVVCFAVLEHYGERIGWYDNWTAKSLSLYVPAPLSRSDLATNLVTEGIFLFLWNGALNLRNWIPGENDRVFITLSEVWTILYWPVNFLVGAWLIVHAYTLVIRRWTRPALTLEVALGALGILTCLYILIQPDLVNVSGDVDGIELINRSAKVTVFVIACVIGWDTWQAFSRWNNRH